MYMIQFVQLIEMLQALASFSKENMYFYFLSNNISEVIRSLAYGSVQIQLKPPGLSAKKLDIDYVRSSPKNRHYA